MCEKATEIQQSDALGWIGGTHQGSNIYYYTGDGRFHSGFYYIMSEYGVDEDTNEEWHRQSKVIWLPRQDQLQEMVKGDKHAHLLVYEFACWFHGSADPLYAMAGSSHGVDDTNSMEQMWLAFVMKERYNKVWRDGEWVYT